MNNQAVIKKIVTAAAGNAKAAEATMRGLDLPNAVVIRSKPSVGGNQFHKIILKPKLSCNAGQSTKAMTPR